MAFTKGSSWKIDIHTHILPETWPDWNREFGYSGWLTISHEMARQGPQVNGFAPTTHHVCQGEKTTTANACLVNPDGTIFRRIGRNCWCPQTRLAECDRLNVAIQVLSTVPGVGFNYWAKGEDCAKVARFLNNHLISLVQNEPNHRFIGLGTLPMQDPLLAIVELERVMAAGLAGVQIGSHVNEWNLDAPELEPFWEAAERLDAAIFVHPWDLNTGSRYSKHWLPWLVDMPNETTMALASLLMGGVLDRHPGTRICFAHGGGSFGCLLGRIDRGFRVRPDLCQNHTPIVPSTYLYPISGDRYSVYIDYLVHDAETLQLLVKKFGPTRIMVGTDYPFPLGEIEDPDEILYKAFGSAKLGRSELLDLIRFENAARFLKIKLSDF